MTRLFHHGGAELRHVIFSIGCRLEGHARALSLIAKLRQVRAGLLHDLLTRGLDPHGQLRDPIAHPEQFQPSPLGQIPKERTPVRTRVPLLNLSRRVPLQTGD